MAGRLAAFFILLRRKSWEEIDFFHEKNNNNCKARGCIFLSGYEGSTSKMLLLLCYGIIIMSFQLNCE